jgi:hypothetical protein
MVNEYEGANNCTFKTGYVECECCCAHHVLRFYTIEGDDTVYVDVRLNPKERNFFHRLWLGIRYAFNRDVCDYECGLIEKSEIDKFITILEGMKNKGE